MASRLSPFSGKSNQNTKGFDKIFSENGVHPLAASHPGMACARLRKE
jgi:hypothetical protein